jgi:hypothetical protein
MKVLMIKFVGCWVHLFWRWKLDLIAIGRIPRKFRIPCCLLVINHVLEILQAYYVSISTGLTANVEG